MKRLIGIDVGTETLRVAVLARDKGELRVLALDESQHDNVTEQVAHLRELLGGEYLLGDRLAACLPANQAFIRQLQFPFHEKRKIQAALSYELSGQLPVSLDGYATFMQPPNRRGKGAEVVAAAVKTDLLQEFLRPFDESGVPLHVLDLAPYAYIAGLSHSFADGVLACVMENGTSLSSMTDGRVTMFRQLPGAAGGNTHSLAVAISREFATMSRSSDVTPTLFLTGNAVSQALVEALEAQGTNMEVLTTTIGRDLIETTFIPAVALALRAEEPDKAGSFNLRSAEFKLKGEWSGLRKAMVAAICLVSLSIVTLSVSIGLQYFEKRRQLDLVQKQINDVYRSTVTSAGPIVDVPLQMQSAIRQLQEEAGLIALDRPSPVELLYHLSDLPEGLEVDLDELSYDQEQIRISGKTDTFESVNRVAERYRSVGQFNRVDIVESKMGVAGQQVGFRMTLTLNEEVLP
jgi:general secretion pathway protein L